ncbi:ACT domain-containing protein [Haliangium sp.]|uniref:ACT domain-containing protein n=1 Tax=Haliangium sp. TaxID=2663208 RepID=UPI003D0BCD2E
MSTPSSLPLRVLAEPLLILRRDPNDKVAVTEEIPAWARDGGLFSMTRSDRELSLVCWARALPADEPRPERIWRGLEISGPLDFDLVGILAAVAVPLAEAGVSIFAISTHDSDYVLVQEPQLATAIAALRDRGHTVETAPSESSP